MRRLYLVRHASPLIQPDQPSREWVLSDRGIAEAQALATTAAGWGIEAVYCGSEPKMRATALILGDATGAPVHVVAAFDELRVAHWIANSDAFNDLVRAILEDAPLPHGVESAADAAARFARGLRLIEPGQFPAAIVSGGRMLTSYLMRTRGVEEPFAYWRAIPFPGWTSIDLDAPREAPLPFSA
jgi:broad specificity phosphatase PhoE